MAKKSMIVLENGSVYTGMHAGSDATRIGEIIFNTSMTGYLDILSDPACAGKIVVLTYPMTGNVGINQMDLRSGSIWAESVVTRSLCEHPSNWQCEGTLTGWLESSGVPAVSGLDTRALVTEIREQGNMLCAVSSDCLDSEALLGQIKAYKQDTSGWLARASSAHTECFGNPDSFCHIAVLDLGGAAEASKELAARGAFVTVYPFTTSADTLLRSGAAALLLTNGPGHADLYAELIERTGILCSQLPAAGFGLGAELIGRAFGARLVRLPHGHHGAYPVKDIAGGNIKITYQNHGYALSLDGSPLIATHANVNDGSVAAFKHSALPVIGNAFYPDTSALGRDNNLYTQLFALCE